MSAPESRASRPVGFIVNPVSGRDVRRVAARAGNSTPQDKRNQVTRAVIGAVAGGAERILVVKEPFRISSGAVTELRLDAKIEILDVGARVRAEDTERAALAMREAGCGAVIVLGGDGTNRGISRVWPDAPLIPISTGTNNVFPELVEATLAGAAAGLVASGRVRLPEVAEPVKVVRIAIEGQPEDLALVDATLLVDDFVGNLLPFDAGRIRRAVLTRAEPAAIGVSPIGGLVCPCHADDEFGVSLECAAPGEGGRALLVPIAPGLYRTVQVTGWKRLELGEPVVVRGPGVLAFDGDRERRLAPGQSAELQVVRDGPRVIDVNRTLALAAERGAFLDRGAWHDAFEER